LCEIGGAIIKSKLPSKTKSTAISSSFRERVNALNVPQPVVAGLIVLLLFTGAWATYRFLSPASPPSVVSGQAKTPELIWLEGKLEQTGKDFNRLPEAERAEADRIAQKNTGVSARNLFSNTKSPGTSQRGMRNPLDGSLIE